MWNEINIRLENNHESFAWTCSTPSPYDRWTSSSFLGSFYTRFHNRDTKLLRFAFDSDPMRNHFTNLKYLYHVSCKYGLNSALLTEASSLKETITRVVKVSHAEQPYTTESKVKSKLIKRSVRNVVKLLVWKGTTIRAMT